MSERYARLAVRLLQRQRASIAPSLGDRGAAVAALEHALSVRARRRLWRRMAIAAAAAVALAGAGALTRTGAPSLAGHTDAPHPPAPVSISGRAVAHRGATLLRAGTLVALGDTVPLRPGDRLSAADDSDLTLALSTGTDLRLPGRGEVELEAIGAVQRFRLRAGRLRAEVAKLRPGQRFLIETSDAEVEVKGTSFELSVEPRPGCEDTGTWVHVFEGVVTVRDRSGETAVPAGSSWPHTCQEKTFGAPAAPSRPHRRLSYAPPLRAAASEAPSPASSPSTLAEQNNLFAAALAAHRRGDRTAAGRFLDELLDRFPTGPLAHSARAERRALQAEPGDPR